MHNESQRSESKITKDEALKKITDIHTKVKDDYLENEIQEMIDVFNSHNIPESNKLCNMLLYKTARPVSLN